MYIYHFKINSIYIFIDHYSKLHAVQWLIQMIVVHQSMSLILFTLRSVHPHEQLNLFIL